jgi:hypothetical protein
MSWKHYIFEVLDPTGLLPISIDPGKDGEPDYSLLVWESEDVPKPTEAEFAVAVAKAQAMTYQTDRRNAYPSIAEQLDLLFHGGLEAWREQIQAVKDEYPKP